MMGYFPVNYPADSQLPKASHCALGRDWPDGQGLAMAGPPSGQTWRRGIQRVQAGRTVGDGQMASPRAIRMANTSANACAVRGACWTGALGGLHTAQGQPSWGRGRWEPQLPVSAGLSNSASQTQCSGVHTAPTREAHFPL